MTYAPIMAAIALSLAGTAQAASFEYSGNTTGSPVYTRALQDFSGTSFFGVDVNYDRLAFTVDASGSYDFLSVADGWDNFLFLYGPSFDPALPLANGLMANDDFTQIGDAGFSFNLVAGDSYVLVTTGFEGGVDFGLYDNSISGPGQVSVVPEPQTYGLMALGLVVLGVATRRRRAAASVA